MRLRKRSADRGAAGKVKDHLWGLCLQARQGL
jgi:hypothetical protein